MTSVHLKLCVVTPKYTNIYYGMDKLRVLIGAIERKMKFRYMNNRVNFREKTQNAFVDK